MTAAVRRLHTRARAIGVIAEGGMVVQTLTPEEYRGLIVLALRSCERPEDVREVGLSAEASRGLWSKLAAEYRGLVGLEAEGVRR